MHYARRLDETKGRPLARLWLHVVALPMRFRMWRIGRQLALHRY
jgi:hypothetical protein